MAPANHALLEHFVELVPHRWQAIGGNSVHPRGEGYLIGGMHVHLYWGAVLVQDRAQERGRLVECVHNLLNHGQRALAQLRVVAELGVVVELEFLPHHGSDVWRRRSRVDLGAHRCIKHGVAMDSIDGRSDFLEGEVLRRSSLEVIRLRALPISPGSDLRCRCILIWGRGSRVTLPLFFPRHRIIRIRRRVVRLAPARSGKIALGGHVERGNMVEGVHLVGYHTTSCRRGDCSRPNQRSQPGVASDTSSRPTHLVAGRGRLRQSLLPEPFLLRVRQWRSLGLAHRLDLAVSAVITSVDSLH